MVICSIRILIIIILLIINNSLSCPCGQPNNSKKNSKIVGGVIAGPNSWPWTVALIYVSRKQKTIRGNKEKQFCGASIINDRYVLTAAHCTYDIKGPLTNYRVFMGDNKINGTNVLKQKIQSIIVHPKFNFQTLDFDISLVRLQVPITFSDTIRPICLEQKDTVINGRTAVVAGWGSIKNGGPTVNVQREVKVDVVPISTCRRNYATARIQITGNMLCASSNKKDSCTGDSGGPLFFKRKDINIYDQIGIVSFGKGCALRNFPGVYTRVSRLKEWIEKNTSDGQKC